MYRSSKRILSLITAAMLCVCAAGAQEPAKTDEVTADWTKVIRISRSTPTLQVVVNPQLLRGAKLHDPSFAALPNLVVLDGGKGQLSAGLRVLQGFRERGVVVISLAALGISSLARRR